jgi:hypothetical protein
MAYTYSAIGYGHVIGLNSGNQVSQRTVDVLSVSTNQSFVLTDSSATSNTLSVGDSIVGFNGDTATNAYYALGYGGTAELKDTNFYPDSVTNPACFCAGTQIATTSGERPVENLLPGDLVITSDGRAEPVRWVGRQTIATRFADPLGTTPIRIGAGAIADGIPARDLTVSPCHAIAIDGVLVQAGALVNGASIVRVTDLPAQFVYYHVELAAHELILAEGLSAESFVDNVDRERFDNWAEREAETGAHEEMTELDMPRAAARRQVPSKILMRIDGRAADLMPAIAIAA